MTTLTPQKDTRRETHITPLVPEDHPTMPYRAMTTLFRIALEQTSLVEPPLARAHALDERIAAEPHVRCIERLLSQLKAELRAEIAALQASAQSGAR